MTERNKDVRRFVCLHGHFYQPPRENPWLEVILREPSADPDHDWTRRITKECYLPNAAARLVDGENRVLHLRNNYRNLSFNFGPTLLRWIARHEPWLMERLRDADRFSAERQGGSGNAMAQVYHHIILPLANSRDKETEIRWGVVDFQFRFGRKPEGMWLSETAVDDETLSLLAREGIRFTVLAPHQAIRWRWRDDPHRWMDVPGGAIPTGRAYRYRCRDGREIALFFYDARIARGIAFEGLLAHSSRLINAVGQAFEEGSPRQHEAWLVHAATDGESYGHHFKFGDMALAAAFEALEKDPELEVVSYGAFLKRFPPAADVEILPNTAWSCPHGVGRWYRDCGCNTGAHPDWNQRWREPLRNALDELRDALAVHYEREMEKLVRDPWEARNDYIRVLLDRENETPRFLERHARRILTHEERRRVLELMEMQRSALSMYISCGWFFDDVGGLETQLILTHACRAMELARKTGGPDLEERFLLRLKDAKSNLEEYGNGAEVYRRWVKPRQVRPEQVVASLAVESLALRHRSRSALHMFAYEAEHEQYVGDHPVPCQVGLGTVVDRRTGRRNRLLHAVLHFGGLDYRCSTKECPDPEWMKRLVEAIRHGAEEGTPEVVRAVDRFFGQESFSLDEILEEPRMWIARNSASDSLDFYTLFQRRFFHSHKNLLWALRRWGIELPEDIRDSIHRVLEMEVMEIVSSVFRPSTPENDEGRTGEANADDFDYRSALARLRSLRDTLLEWGVGEELSLIRRKIGEHLKATFMRLLEGKVEAHQDLCRLVNIAEIFSLNLRDWWLVTLWFEVMHVSDHEAIQAWKKTQGECARRIDRLLGCRFAKDE